MFCDLLGKSVKFCDIYMLLFLQQVCGCWTNSSHGYWYQRILAKSVVMASDSFFPHNIKVLENQTICKLGLESRPKYHIHIWELKDI